MADREYFVKKMKDLRDEMQSHYLKEFKEQIKEVLMECPDIGLICMATYTPFFNDGYDCICFYFISTFMRRLGNPIGEDSLLNEEETDLPEEVKAAYATTPCESIGYAAAHWEAKELGLDKEIQQKLQVQHEKIEDFLNSIKETMHFFIPEDSIWFIANHNNEIHFDVREYKDHE